MLNRGPHRFDVKFLKYTELEDDLLYFTEEHLQEVPLEELQHLEGPQQAVVDQHHHLYLPTQRFTRITAIRWVVEDSHCMYSSCLWCI